MTTPRRNAARYLDCPTCSTSFRPTTGQLRRLDENGVEPYCSAACRSAALHVTLPCAGCGQDVTRSRKQRERATTEVVLCSRECAAKVGTRPKEGRHIPCEQCGTDFWARPSDMGKARFCSVACKLAYDRRGQITRACEHCGVEFTRAASRMGGGASNAAGRFCTKRCEGDYRTEHAQGSVNADGYRVRHIKGRPVLEHRLVAAEVLGRPLLRSEEVHHVNGDRAENRVGGPFVLDDRGRLRSGNLEVWSTSQPAGQEVGPKVEWARGLLALYGSVWERERYADYLPAEVAPC